ncbi:MtrB/PioB family decaheme-associated outer membrane protein [Pseudothauera nasutitermitis]|uniref:MtrB/PioB family decaheme-associated outer membrane protein n=1 Tax=Pseudothauera nasutitermitis TaxID=2565930 RepID=A0A4S4AY80_9RHOO|nr:MtrB/PioB family decaheme-associated outer membrane protein [Pseudothauera nasutitermitis]THF63572.1 MtrB/PioB family decaheme-associated outer membrane protein [Pseudothauera nasutitermitis]
MNMHKSFRLSAVAMALYSAFGGTAWAQEMDELDELIKPESKVSVGIGVWSKDRAQQGIYDGMREGDKAFWLLDADIVKRDEVTGTWMTLKTDSLGVDGSRSLQGEYLRQGDIGIKLEYNRITRESPQTFNTPLQGAGTTKQTVVNTGLDTAPRRDLTLGTLREQTSLGLYKNLLPGLDLNINYQHEEKTGTRAWSPGHSVHFVTEPVDSTTRQIETALSYTTKKWQLRGGYNGSWYKNNNPLVRVGYTGAGSVTNPTYLSFPGDNEAHQFFLNGGYNFTPTTRATLKLEYARAIQDDSLPTNGVTDWPSEHQRAVGPDKLDGKVDTRLVHLGLTSRPFKNFSLNASLRYHDVEDKTPIRTYSTAGAAYNATSPDYVRNSYTTVTSKLEGTYRFAKVYSFTAGVEDKRQDRDRPLRVTGAEKEIVVPLRSQVDETTGRLELRRSLSDVANGRISYLHSRRSGNRYKRALWDHSDDVGLGGLQDIRNLTNPLHMAGRDRDRLRLSVDWSPSEALSFQFSAEEGRDDYDNQATMTHGLDKGTNRLYSIDAVYTVSDELKLTAWYSYDQNKAEQSHYRTHTTGGSGGGFGDPAVKYTDLQDTGNSLGLGLRWEFTSRLNFGADLEWFRSVSKYGQDVSPLAAGGVAVFPTQANLSLGVPDIENKLLRLSLFSTYAIDKSADVRFDFIHERWKTDDWTWQFADGSPFVYGANANVDGTTVYTKPKQVSNFFSVRYIYKFQ